ncbi:MULTISPECIES: hypothetical protein [unclassified Campylobacter]|uniref:hypothetical protein n=1 Tax=unclassified Campylobacter TaxID=2593542 RepID=UPI0022E9A186|nr:MULTISPECIES: hypothetical protein [unclassified Campylobacter]MDA3062366.1 hypothetical protein [Campylobacter sp. JMF_14 EL1]MDA3073516.1 hypothetical protein [Campylobacter sp. JMF_10 EL2]MDA3076867.1 hypothetical protein [Campylobacter sp. JMF_04 NA10]
MSDMAKNVENNSTYEDIKDKFGSLVDAVDKAFSDKNLGFLSSPIVAAKLADKILTAQDFDLFKQNFKNGVKEQYCNSDIKNKNFKATFTYNFDNEYFMDFTLGLSDCR